MFKRKKKTGCETPQFRNPTAPPLPMSIVERSIKLAKKYDDLVETCKTSECWQPTNALDTKPPNAVSSVVKPNHNYAASSTNKTSCTYATPCGWCSKWDKVCDNKPYNGEQINKLDDYLYDVMQVAFDNEECEKQCDHQWEGCAVSTKYSTYICRKCYEIRCYPNAN